MMKMSGKFFSFLVILFFLANLLACSPNGQARQVVIYTSVDQVYAEPVLKRFTVETGIQVKPIYDVEATKTTGLVNRLIAEKDRPLADVFWSGEFVEMLLLQEKGALQAYRSLEAADIPAIYKDPDGYWTGFARTAAPHSSQPASSVQAAASRWRQRRGGPSGETCVRTCNRTNRNVPELLFILIIAL